MLVLVRGSAHSHVFIVAKIDKHAKRDFPREPVILKFMGCRSVASENVVISIRRVVI